MLVLFSQKIKMSFVQ